MGDRPQERGPRAKCDAAPAGLPHEHAKRLQAATSALAHEQTRIITALAKQLEGSCPGCGGGGSASRKKHSDVPSHTTTRDAPPAHARCGMCEQDMAIACFSKNQLQKPQRHTGGIKCKACLRRAWIHSMGKSGAGMVEMTARQKRKRKREQELQVATNKPVATPNRTSSTGHKSAGQHDPCQVAAAMASVATPHGPTQGPGRQLGPTGPSTAPWVAREAAKPRAPTNNSTRPWSPFLDGWGGGRGDLRLGDLGTTTCTRTWPGSGPTDGQGHGGQRRLHNPATNHTDQGVDDTARRHVTHNATSPGHENGAGAGGRDASAGDASKTSDKVCPCSNKEQGCKKGDHCNMKHVCCADGCGSTDHGAAGHP